MSRERSFDSREGNALGPRGPRLSRLCYLIGPAALLTSAFLNFVGYHRYSLISPEIFLAVLTLALAGIGIGLFMALRPATFGHLLLVACVVVFFDLTASDFNIVSLLPNENTEKAETVWHWGIILLFFGFSLAVHRHFSFIVTVSAIAFAAFAVMFAGKGNVEVYARQDHPPLENPKAPIIHLVFDEFIGVEGIPTEITGGEDLKQEIKAFYKKYGFNLYGSAFSHSSSTGISLAALLNGQEYPTSETAFKRVRGVRILGRNAWFERLGAEGYAIRVFDNSWLSYCDESNAAIVSCETFPANTVKSLEGTDIGGSGKAKVLVSAFLEGSSALGLIRPYIGLPVYRVGALDAPDILKSVADSIEANPTRTAFFAHVLSPHNSYVFDEFCRPKRNVRHWLRRMNDFDVTSTTINSPASRQERYKAYFAQVRCTQRLLEAFFERLRKEGIYQRATIIVHGDHGSRIGIHSPNAKAEHLIKESDLHDHYSTLFAVKRPLQGPDYDTRPRSIQALFGELFLGRNLTTRAGSVILRRREGEEAIWLPIRNLGS